LIAKGRRALVEHDKGLDRHARPYAARVDQSAIRLVVAEQQRPKERTGAFGIGPADNDELGPIKAFALDPGTAIAGQIGPIEPLRDHAFEAMFAWHGERLRHRRLRDRHRQSRPAAS
jgi:hypothetical protein